MQFDVPKTKVGESIDAAKAELLALALDMDIKDLLMQANHDDYSSDGDEEDDVDGWVDEQGRLLASDMRELDKDVQPIWKTLVKVCHWQVMCTVTLLLM